MSPDPPSRPRAASWLAWVTLLSGVPFLLTWLFGPDSGMEAMVLLIPWVGMLAAHAVFGIPALVLAWIDRRPRLLAAFGVYLACFTGVHLVGWAVASDVPQTLEVAYLERARPSDHALLELASGSVIRPGARATGEPAVGDRERVRALAAEGADLDRVGPYGMTALYRAAGHDLPLTVALLEAGADPNRQTAQDGAPLHIAIRQGEGDIVRALLAHGADPNLAEPDGDRPICRVLAQGAGGELSAERFRTLEALLDAGADPGTCGAFASAVRQRQSRSLRVLLAHGYRGTAAEADGLRQSLVQAVRSKDTEWVTLLLEAGADGRQALALAVERHDEERVRALLEGGADTRAEAYLVSTVGSAKADAITALLLEHGANPAAIDEKGRTPLVQAVRAAHDDNVRRLVSLGADPDQHWQGEPLVLSLQTMIPDKKHVTALLLDLGADPNAHGGEGRTPLMKATRNSHHELMNALLAAGAEVDAADGTGRTALHHAAETRFESEVGLSLLIEGGASVDVADTEGRTPLCVAEASGNRSAARHLEASGARPQACGKIRRPAQLEWRGRKIRTLGPYPAEPAPR